MMLTRLGALLLLVSLATGCLPPPAPQGGAVPESGGTTTAAASGGDCAAACSKLIACQLVADQDACVQECAAQGFGPDVTGGLAAGSCADDAAWIARTYPSEQPAGPSSSSGGGEGSSCTGGSGGCGGYTICCAAGGGEASYGAPGVCHQAAICNAPRR